MTEKQLFNYIEQGGNYSFSLDTQTLTIKGGYIYRDGMCELDGEVSGINEDFISTLGDDVLENIRILYYIFAHTQQSSNLSGGTCWFRALPADQLSSDDLNYAPSRHVAKFYLEYYFLKSVCDRSLTWDMLDPTNRHWFWKDKENNDSHLCIMRDWFPIIK